MTGFTKLFGSIIHSTIWREPDHVRLVWVTMLALADRDGRVEAAVPGLADVARVSLEQCIDALERFSKPDKWSRNQEHEGRRIETVDGGWRLLNHGRYRDLMSAEERRERDRIRKQEARAAQRLSARCPQPSENVREVSHAAPAPAPAPTPEAGSESCRVGDSTTMDVARVFDGWKLVFEHPKAKLDRKRTAIIKARLTDGFTVPELLTAFRGALKSDWHMGRDPRTNGTRYDGLQTLLRDRAQVEKFIEIAEGKVGSREGAVLPGRGLTPRQGNHGKTGFEKASPQ